MASAIGALLIVTSALGADDAVTPGVDLAGPIRFVVGAPTRFTLLDPDWLLPPVESLDQALQVADDETIAEELLRDGAETALAPREGKRSGDGKIGYSLSDNLTANVGYHHSRLSDLSASQTLRDDQWSAFTTRPDRDVLDLKMSWRLRDNTVGLGYQFQSDRLGSSAGEGAFSRFLPSSPQTTHALTVGLTRTWGASAPPVPAEALLFPPDLAADVPEPTLTPSP